jgi:hypothetical protein
LTEYLRDGSRGFEPFKSKDVDLFTDLEPFGWKGVNQAVKHYFGIDLPRLFKMDWSCEHCIRMLCKVMNKRYIYSYQNIYLLYLTQTIKLLLIGKSTVQISKRGKDLKYRGAKDVIASKGKIYSAVFKKR